MPKKGYKSITVTDKLYDMIGKEAEARGLSLPGTIRSLLVASAKEHPRTRGVEYTDKEKWRWIK